MNIPGPIKQEVEYIGNGVMGMVQSGSETINNLMENLGTALPYVVVSGLVITLAAKYGIEFTEKLFKKA